MDLHAGKSYTVSTAEQGSKEWLKDRSGIVTASMMHVALAEPRDGADVSKTRSKYMRQLVSEILTDEPCQTFSGNMDTDRGHALEPVIRELYEAQTGHVVHQVGFLRNDKMRLGCSPDGLIDLDRGCEIKSKRGDIMVEILLSGKTMPKSYALQVQTCLLVSEREIWDFCPQAPGLPFRIQEVVRDEYLIGKIEKGLPLFYEELDEMVDKVKKLY